jgi:OmpA-OmpF porin, OOP family
LEPQFQGLSVTLQAQGFGDTRPVAKNTKPDGSDNPAGRKRNRRVTITFTSGA